MIKNKKLLIGAILSAFAGSAHATNGMFSHGYGTANKGLAGAGVASTNQGAISSATNPASMAFVGNELTLGLELFAPRRSYETNDNGGSGFELFPAGNGTGNKVESQNDWFGIPSFAYSMKLGGSNLGIAVYGNGGMNAEYRADDTIFGLNNVGVQTLLAGNGFSQGPFGGGTASIDLSQLFTNLSFASKLSEHSSWGVSLIFAVQSLKIRGVQSFAGFTETFNQVFGATLAANGNNIPLATAAGLAAVDNMSNQGREYAFGAGGKIGYLTEVMNGVSVGLSYQSKIYMTEYDDYSDLLAENGDLDIPATASVGVTWDLTPKSTLLLDVQYIFYSDVDAIGNSIDKLAGCPSSGGGTNTANCFGGDDGAGFGWSDMSIIKLGWEWQSNPEWIWRVGYSHGKQPIPSSETALNILAPALIENHVTFGFTKKISKNSDFNFAAMYAPKSSVTGNSVINSTLDANLDGIPETAAEIAQTTELEMHQYSLEASWSTRW